jgi:hypothetical protein
MPAKKKSTPKAPAKVKGVDVSSLTTRQRLAMKKHSKHHTAKHLKGMVSAMKKGKKSVSNELLFFHNASHSLCYSQKYAAKVYPYHLESLPA